MADVETREAPRYWFSWRNAYSGEIYGESNLYAVACELARRISVEPLVGGQPQHVNLYEEPAIRLLAYYRDGQVEQIAEPTQGPGPSPRSGRPSSRGGVALDSDAKRQLALLVHERDEIAARRLAADLPPDAWQVRYLVVEEKGTEAPLGWGADTAEAAKVAAEARARGQEVQFRESLDWTLVEL
jgi:hypothetical protein